MSLCCNNKVAKLRSQLKVSRCSAPSAASSALASSGSRVNGCGCRPVTDSFNCCKLCSADGLWVARADLENALMQMQHLLARVFQNGLRGQVRRFIVQWMETLPAHVRKHLSYAGALRRRQIFWAFASCPGLVWRSATRSTFWGGLFRSRKCSVLPCILHDLAWALG